MAFDKVINKQDAEHFAAPKRVLLTKELRDLAGVDRRVNPAVGFATKDVCMLTVVIIAEGGFLSVSKSVSRCQYDAQRVLSGKVQDKDLVTPTRHSMMTAMPPVLCQFRDAHSQARSMLRKRAL